MHVWSRGLDYLSYNGSCSGQSSNRRMCLQMTKKVDVYGLEDNPAVLGHIMVIAHHKQFVGLKDCYLGSDTSRLYFRKWLQLEHDRHTSLLKFVPTTMWCVCVWLYLTCLLNIFMN